MRIGIIGAGVAGLFTAIELVNNGFKGSDIIIFDKGKEIEKRHCFVDDNTQCKKCKTCSIVNGVGGAGSFSDSKLNFDPSGKVGGEMNDLMTREEIIKYLIRVYGIYQQFGIEEFQSKMYGMNHNDAAKEILKVIEENPNMDITDCITVHLGTENSRIIYGRMITFLKEHGVDIVSDTEIVDIKIDNVCTVYYKYKCKSDYSSYDDLLEEEQFDKVILAMGRSGNKAIKYICESNGIEITNGRVDYGVRIETLNSIMAPLNDNFYEAKIHFKGGPFGDKARTFCTNPGGFVTIESYNTDRGKLFLANGHAYAGNKSDNTNFAILVSRAFNEDCPNPLESYLFPLIQATNSLGKGSVILQSLKDIKLNKRSTEESIAELDIKPTANVYKGDLTSVIPYRTMVDILEAIEELDKICPGINGDNTLLYGLEAKFHANRVIIDKYGKTSNENIYCIGDCSGMCRGLTTAASMGILCAEDILKNV